MYFDTYAKDVINAVIFDGYLSKQSSKFVFLIIIQC